MTQTDYDQLIPSWEALIARHGKMRLLFVMHDFHGWEPQAAWEDFRFDIKHQKGVERIAMLGEKKWQQWMTKIASWFVQAGVRYFRCVAGRSSRALGARKVTDLCESCGTSARSSAL